MKNDYKYDNTNQSSDEEDQSTDIQEVNTKAQDLLDQ